MYQKTSQQAISEYRNAGLLTETAEASPHRLVQMLYDGALERLATARVAMEHGNLTLKGERISRVLDILASLQAHLDFERGGEISTNLDALYDYMQRRLLDANATDNLEALDEVTKLLREVKEGWDAIKPE